MSSEHVAHAASDIDHSNAGHAEHGMSDVGYMKVALALAVMTGIEVALTYIRDDIGVMFMPILLILMAIKFLTVVSYFMHLKFDNKIFTWLFYAGLILAVGVYCAALATFHFFQPS
jgi:cytochrome c oxidase subunit 4